MLSSGSGSGRCVAGVREPASPRLGLGPLPPGSGNDQSNHGAHDGCRSDGRWSDVGPERLDWVGPGSGGTKFSTLTQINADNVKNLKRAWTFHTGDTSGFFESGLSSLTA